MVPRHDAWPIRSLFAYLPVVTRSRGCGTRLRPFRVTRNALVVVHNAAPGQPPVGEWVGYRGALLQGVAVDKGLPTHFGEGLNMRWVAALPGTGNSSPTIYGDSVFLTAETSSQPPDLLVLCFDRDVRIACVAAIRRDSDRQHTPQERICDSDHSDRWPARLRHVWGQRGILLQHGRPTALACAVGATGARVGSCIESDLVRGSGHPVGRRLKRQLSARAELLQWRGRLVDGAEEFGIVDDSGARVCGGGGPHAVGSCGERHGQHQRSRGIRHRLRSPRRATSYGVCGAQRTSPVPQRLWAVRWWSAQAVRTDPSLPCGPVVAATSRSPMLRGDYPGVEPTFLRA